MSTRNALTVVLVLAFVAGQTPYASLYCAMMKRSVDVRMLQQCASHASAGSHGTLLRRGSQNSPLRLLEKPVTDNSEHIVARIISAQNAVGLTAGIFEQRSRSVHFFAEEPGCPPPDIVILSRTFRI